jgi:flagellar motor switch protein FliN/FliY
MEATNSAVSQSIDPGDMGKNLDVIQDVKVTLSMELGRTTLSIRELLQLSQGSVIELERMVDEHMDVLVNGTLVAHGEVVVIDDKFGIRLTDVVNPMERVKPLR